MQPPNCFEQLEQLLHARRSRVPDTANCQYYALVEALHRVRMQDPHCASPIITLTSQLKQAIADTFQSDPKLETRFCNVDLLMERMESRHVHGRSKKPSATQTAVPIVDDTGLGETQQRQFLLNYFMELAKSESQVDSTVPKHLAGGLDTLRLASKFLHRTIFIVSKPTVDFNGPLHLLKIEPDAHARTSVIRLPEWPEWLEGINCEFTHDRFPLVLALKVEHYSSIFLESAIDIDLVLSAPTDGEMQERRLASRRRKAFGKAATTNSVHPCVSDSCCVDSPQPIADDQDGMDLIDWELRNSLTDSQQMSSARRQEQTVERSSISCDLKLNPAQKSSDSTNKSKTKHHSTRRKCTVPQCRNNAVTQGKCRSHGGGRRCYYPKCEKSAQSRSFFCWGHGGGQRCEALGCMRSKSSKRSTRFCSIHLDCEAQEGEKLVDSSVSTHRESKTSRRS